MHKNICNVLERDINTRFLVNVSYKNRYEVISDFFGFTFTRNSYNFFFKGNQIIGFNNSFNVFLCPWQKKKIDNYIETLKFKEEKELFDINALIVNGRLLNLYSEEKKNSLYMIFENQKNPLFELELYFGFYLSYFLKYNLKFLLIQIYILINSKKQEWI